MQNQKSQPTKQSIKIDSRFKGLNHYEDYLIKKHRREVKQFLFERDIKPIIKIKVLKIYDKRIDRNNIISVYTHTVQEFLMHLLDDTLAELANYSSCSNIS